MARPKSLIYKKWTEEEKQYLKDNFFKTDINVLAEHFDRTLSSVDCQYRLLIGSTVKDKKPKVKTKMQRCPNCKKEINRVEMGYFCKECLKEYDNYGDLIAPLL